MALPIKEVRNSSGIVFDYAHMSALCDVGWQDVMFAVEGGYMGWRAILDHAMAILEEGSSEELFELASMRSFPDTADKLDAIDLAERLTPVSGDAAIFAARDKTAYAALAWLYANRGRVDRDPVDIIEAVYADLWYPDDLACLVPWMPGKAGPNAFPSGAGWNLEAEWERYLKNAAVRCGRRRGNM